VFVSLPPGCLAEHQALCEHVYNLIERYVSARLFIVLSLLVRLFVILFFFLDISLFLFLFKLCEEVPLHFCALLKELKDPLLVVIHKGRVAPQLVGADWRDQTVDHLDKEGYQMHVVLGAAAVSVPREGILVGQTLQEHLKVVQKDLDSVWIYLADVLLLRIEVLLDCVQVAVHSQLASS
jgi:hypothetical protein